MVSKSFTVLLMSSASVAINALPSNAPVSTGGLCANGDFGCVAAKAIEAKANGFKFCKEDDYECQLQNLITSVQSLKPPFNQYMPVYSNKSVVDFTKVKTVKDKFTKKDMQSMQVVHSNKVQNQKIQASKLFRNRNRRQGTLPTDTNDKKTDEYCLQWFNETRYHCEYKLLQQRVLFCATYLYMKEDTKGEKYNLEMANLADDDTFMYYNDDDLTVGDDTILGDDDVAPTVDPDEMNWFFEDDHAVGVSDDCFVNLVNLMVSEKIPKSDYTMPKPSFVCAKDEHYDGEALTNFGQLDCDDAIQTLLGLQTFDMKASEITSTWCGLPLTDPVGKFFNETITLGSLIITAGAACCGGYHGQRHIWGNPVCDQWLLDSQELKLIPTGEPVDIHSGTFSWTAYWKQYNNAEAWVVPCVFLLGVIGVVLMIVKKATKKEEELKQFGSPEKMFHKETFVPTPTNETFQNRTAQLFATMKPNTLAAPRMISLSDSSDGIPSRQVSFV